MGLIVVSQMVKHSKWGIHPKIRYNGIQMARYTNRTYANRQDFTAERAEIVEILLSSAACGEKRTQLHKSQLN